MAELAKKLQQDTFNSIYDLRKNHKKCGKDRLTYGYYQARHKRLADLWAACTEQHKLIISEGELEAEKLAEYLLEFRDVEEVYMELFESFENGSNQFNNHQPSTSASTPPVVSGTSNSIRLESISIPSFDGEYGKWRTFIDLFTCMVHNNNTLSSVEKMQYLKTHLTGDAAKVIQHMDIANENYSTAWTILHERFDNKRAMAWNYMHKFFDLPPAKEEQDAAIKNILNTVSEFLANMKGIGIDTRNWDSLIVFIVSQKLDMNSRKQWEVSLGSSPEIPLLKTFMDFLTARFRAFEALGAPKKTRRFEALVSKDVTSCIYCKKEHSIMHCNAFKALNLTERRKAVKEQKVCYNCLRKGHNVASCQSKSTCHTCKKKHHTLLHYDARTQNESNNQTKPVSTNSLVAKQGFNTQTVLLATAKVHVKNTSGQIVTLRALIDSGSQKSFITENAAQILGTRRSKAKLTINGLGSNSTIQTRGLIELDIQPKYGKNIRIPALIIPKITNICPAKELELKLPGRFYKHELADPDYGTPGNIDILLGADVYGLIALSEFRQGSPCAVKTRLGWILLGPVDDGVDNNNIISMVSTEDTTNEILRKLWELEEPQPVKKYTEEEEETLKFYKSTTKRDSSGRYVVRLPFKANATPGITLRGSRKSAYIQFTRLEKRFAADAKLKNQYSSFIKEYIELGHMEKVDPSKVHAADAYYMPHHAVIKESSSTTKLRVVFNASQTTPSGKSLNDLLFVGPSIQNSLINIIMKWRKPKYVMAADAKQMFRQIMVDPKDCEFQRILWRNNPEESIEHYKLTTVTYGTASAPFLAIQTLHQLAEDEIQNYSEACNVTKEDFYVDDVFTGSDSIEAAKKLQSDLNTVMAKGGFHLRKWTANHSALLESIPSEDRETQLPLSINVTENIKALGLQWNPVNDSFTFKVSLPPVISEGMTKRQLLSETCQLFDPIGWMQPCVIIGRVIMQQLWLKKKGWDEPIDQDSYWQWMKLRNQLPILQEILIPRWLPIQEGDTIQIHGFCDASLQAYAAVIYIRIESRNGKTITRLITAKAKVAPVKMESIPHLELCGAVMLTQLMKVVHDTYGWSNVKTFYWSDSSIVLCWLQDHPSRWKTFVANRVSQIQQNSDIHQWEYVPGTTNPADVATRGKLPEALKKCYIWWEGPAWLLEIRSQWPRMRPAADEAIVNQELRSNRIICYTSTNRIHERNLTDRFSTLTKLVRVIAYCRRWKWKPTTSFLNAQELKEAEMACVRLVQNEAYPEEIKRLSKKEKIAKSSPLVRLTPCYRSDPLLRVGGRLEHSSACDDKKHPIIIPRGHFANLIIRHYHHLTLHGGSQLVLATIREKYWIINGLTAIKTLVRKCVTCFRATARPAQQLMGQLPSARVNPGKPFLQTGVDYAGPITIKWNGGRGAKTTKGYIVVFVCLSTKAIHLELASDLSTPTCIAAIRRFIARRGFCHTLMSDNGTNFVGADRMLKEYPANMIQEVQEHLASHKIEWKFIPPGSPHFGGIWEAAVKSMKRHLFKVIGDTLLNVEEMYTLLAQIEACMNSRPLTPVSDDPNDLTALTPGHFLTGQNLFELPDGRIEDNVTKKWQSLQKMKRQFWHRWSLEYLTQLQQKAKWFTENHCVNVGDLVLIKIDHWPSLSWPLGRVLETHPGKDKLARVATIKTATGILKRPFAKICPLPKEDQDLTIHALRPELPNQPGPSGRSKLSKKPKSGASGPSCNQRKSKKKISTTSSS